MTKKSQPAMILWAIAEDIRTLAKVARALQQSGNLSGALRDARVWGMRQKLVERAVRRFTPAFAESVSGVKAELIVQAARLTGGPRKIIAVTEVQGMEGDVVTMQEIFAFKQTGIDSKGMVKGRFVAGGIMPKFIEKFKVMNIPVPYELFDENNVMEI